MIFSDVADAKPFLKWAGGKTQLLTDISKRLPRIVKDEKFTFIEPFVGSGAVLFWMLANFPNVSKAVINDANADLINLYKTIKSSPGELIEILEKLQSEFLSLEHKSDDRKEFYYKIREAFNQTHNDSVLKSAHFIFLNRTCFNGLFRVNSKNQFNVPMGDYKNPAILNSENLLNVSSALQNVEILSGDYSEVIAFCDQKTFVYFDPPYKPLSKTSSFNSYGKEVFDDNEQIRLKEFCDELTAKEISWMLSNSDVKGSNPEDNFFDDLYADYNIERVYAKRNINSKSASRGQISEILITNY